jgi:hypothetical protein
MSETICGSVFEGVRGTLQVPQAILDYYVPVGGNQAYVQKIKDQANVSQIIAWKRFQGNNSLNVFVKSLNAVKGLRKKCILTNGGEYNNCILLDFTVNNRRHTSTFYVEFNMSILVDVQ